MNVALDRFGGIIPRLSPHQLPASGASVAHNVQLRNGRLEPWRESCDYADISTVVKSFYIHGCCILHWDYQTCVANPSPEWGRLYMTSQNSGRMGAWAIEPTTQENGELCSSTYTKLGLPNPTTGPAVSGTEACGRRTDARAYVYTYVNKWGEESAPSPVSPVIQVNDGASVTVSGFVGPPAIWGVTHINVYRAASGFYEEDGKVQRALTDFLYVGTTTVSASSFVDRIQSAYLGAPLETEDVQPAPEKLQNLTAIGGQVRLAGSRWNRVHLSENLEPYNWPAKYELTLDYNIIHMKAIGKRLFVTTDSNPYVIDVSACTDRACYAITESPLPYPDIGCLYNEAAIVTPFGLAYSTPVGVGILDASGKVSIVTKSWFGENDWVQVKPETARFGWWQGYLFIITDEVSFMLKLDRDSQGDFAGGELTTISDKPIAMQSSPTGKLFMVEDRKVGKKIHHIAKIWNQGKSLRPYVWESRELTGPHDDAGTGNALGSMWSPASCKVQANGAVDFTLRTKHGTVFKRGLPGDRAFRLPRIGRHLYYTVRFEGTAAVEYVDLGTAHWTVNMGA